MLFGVNRHVRHRKGPVAAYGPDKNRARVGFFNAPTRALVSELAPKSARISMVAGARYVVLKKIPGRRVELVYAKGDLKVVLRTPSLLVAA